MKYAVAWSENLWFVECPECGHSHQLGDAAVYSDHHFTCEECEETFMCGPGRDEYEDGSEVEE